MQHFTLHCICKILPTAELKKNIQPQRSHQAPVLASALYHLALVVIVSFCFMHRHVFFVDDESIINIEHFFLFQQILKFISTLKIKILQKKFVIRIRIKMKYIFNYWIIMYNVYFTLLANKMCVQYTNHLIGIDTKM